MMRNPSQNRHRGRAFDPRSSRSGRTDVAVEQGVLVEFVIVGRHGSRGRGEGAREDRASACGGGARGGRDSGRGRSAASD